MADETLLSDLCSTCNNARSKYRCPGCAARTCSLPCYKRHQTWAQCTGKRDPTKFVKKSQLATPAGIDHDFNFLTSIERSVERSEREAQGRGLDGAQTGQPRSALTSGQYADTGVHVVRAPKGLSRQKDNRTRISKNKNLIWSVEWIHEDRSRSLSDVPASQAIGEAYRYFRPQSRSGKKRKRAIEGTETGTCQAPQNAEHNQDEIKPDPGQEADVAGAEPASPRRASTSDAHASGPEGHAQVASPICPSPHVNGPVSEPIPSQHYFFLLRPRTNTNRHVLIPISPLAPLQDTLRGKTVLEFPTIYVFSSDQVPADFILDDHYTEQGDQDTKHMHELLQVNSALRGQDRDSACEELDSKKILDVLKQDLSDAL